MLWKPWGQCILYEQRNNTQKMVQSFIPSIHQQLSQEYQTLGKSIWTKKYQDWNKIDITKYTGWTLEKQGGKGVQVQIRVAAAQPPLGTDCDQVEWYQLEWSLDGEKLQKMTIAMAI